MERGDDSMSSSIDNKVVSMSFDNSNFEKNTAQSIGTVDKLKNSLKLDGVSKGLNEVGNASSKINMNPLAAAAESVSVKFSALQVVAVTALANITNSAINAGTNIVRALTIDPVMAGFNEYETQINAIQTILANTSSKGTNLQQVSAALDQLNTYADKTIYNFTEMTRNIGTFTAAGIDLDTSVTAIKGISNLAAVSGSTSQQASTAMYQLSQALSSGTVKLQDWNSVVNAGMGGQVFQDALKDTARLHGVSIDEMITKEGSFRETLKDGWLSSEILTETLAKFTGDLSEEQLRSMGYAEDQIAAIIKMGITANDAATKVKTISQLFDTLKEAAQSGWTKTWEILIGDFEEAKILLTSISEVVGGVIGASADARNAMLTDWKTLGGRAAIIESIRNVFVGLISILKPIREAFTNIFPPITGKQLFDLSIKIQEITSKFKLSGNQAEKLKNTFSGLFAILSIIGKGLGFLLKAVAPIVLVVTKLANALLGVTSVIGLWLVGIDKSIGTVNIFAGAIAKLGSIFKPLINTVKSAYDTFTSSFIAKSKKSTDALIDMKDKQTSVFKAMGESFSNNKILASLQNIGSKVGVVFTKIISIVGSSLGKLQTFVSGLSFGDIIGALNFAGVVATLGMLRTAVSNISAPFLTLQDTLKGFKGITKNVNEILGSVRKNFEEYQNNLKAKTLKDIAVAIGILVASILVLSTIDSKALAKSVAALGLVFAELVATMYMLSEYVTFSKSMLTAIPLLIGMSVAVLILSTAISQLAKLDPASLAIAMAGLTVLIAEMVLVAKTMAKHSKGLTKGIGTLILFSFAIRLLADVVIELSALGWKAIVKGVGAVGALMLGLAITAKILATEEKTIMSGVLSLIAFAVAIKILASAVTELATLNPAQLQTGLIGVGGLLLGISLFLSNTPMNKNAALTAMSIVMLAAALKVMGMVVADLGSLSAKELTKGMLAIGSILVAVTVFGERKPESIFKAAASLIVLGIAMRVLTESVMILGKMDDEALQKGLFGMAFGLTALTTAAKLAPTNMFVVAAGMIVMSSAMVILATALKIIGSMSITEIVTSLTTITIALGIFIGAAMLTQAIIVPLLALGAAFALLGVGAMGLGVGLMALATGFTILAAISASAATALVNNITKLGTAIIKLIPSLAVAVGKGLIEIVKVIGENIQEVLALVGRVIAGVLEILVTNLPTILGIITTLLRSAFDTTIALFLEYAPLIADALLIVYDSFLASMDEHLPGIVEKTISIITTFIDTLAANIDPIVQSGVGFILAFLQGLSDANILLIEGAFRVMIDFLNGLADTLDANSAILGAAIGRLFWSIIQSAWAIMTGAIGTFLGKAGEWVGGMARGISDKIGEVTGAIGDIISGAVSGVGSKVSEFFDAGADTINGFIRGLASKADAVKAKAESIISAGVEKVRSFLDINSPSRVFAKIGAYSMEGLIVGFDAMKGSVVNSAKSVAKGMVNVVDQGLGYIENLAGLDVAPVVSPIVDLTNIQNGAGLLDDLFGQRSMALAGSVTMQSEVDSQDSKLVEIITAVVERLNTLSDDRELPPINLEVTTTVDGAPIAKTIAPLVNEQIQKQDMYDQRKRGIK